MKLNKLRERGYVLPAAIMLCLGIAILSVGVLQITTTSSNNLNSQAYKAIADESAAAGIAYASSCISNNPTTAWASPLTPATDCTGATGSGGASYVNQQGTEYQSTFSVAPQDAQSNITATGTVKILNNGNPVTVATSTRKMNVSGLFTSVGVSTGESITAIKNDQTDCSIANGKLYCWGNNDYGQLGRGYTGSNAANATPTLVAGAIAGKTVTKVTVAYESVCVIADGTPYCWGGNGNGQLGDGTNTAKNIPTANVPTTSSGPLSGKFTTDIGLGSENNPASIVWPFAEAFPHTCAMTADGSVSCWGDGGFRQNTGGGMNVVFFVPTGFYTYPSYLSPTLIMGYSDNSAPLAGMKSERAGSASHDGCSVAQGKMFCWGVPAPIALWCTSVLFSEAYETVVPFNGCVGSFSNGYDTSAIGGSAYSGKFLDASTWDISADETCGMANTSYVCFGTTPAFDLFWSGGYGAPWTAAANADVTDSDNGDSIPSWGSAGLYCMINKGVAYCSASPFNAYSGTGTSGYASFAPLISTTGLSGKSPTKIAAGQNHGCVIANGELLCWGDGSYGMLADGNINSHYVASATLSANSTLGTVDGTYAASGAISVGGSHSCGVANGKLFCWGDNTYGQLGTGGTIPQSKPQIVPGFNTFNAVTKVSAGANHTCAIVYGQLYCWGRNNSGQLGLGTSDNSAHSAPVLVNGHGALTTSMRVTDVSAGNNSTCATANGQAYCWGDDSNKKLGNADGTFTQQNSPVLVNGHGALTTAMSTTAITVGTNHACAIANGDAYCWGSNASGETGLNTTVGNNDPTLLTAGSAGTPTGPNGTRPLVSGISAGVDFTCAIFNGKVGCWGNNANGRTGRGTTVGTQNTPALLNGAPGGYYATVISAGSAHACAVLNGNSSATNGNLYCWGTGANGRLGNNATGDQSTAVLATATTDPTSGKLRIASNVAAGGSTSCAVANGDILCWGAGTSGQTGNGLSVDSSVPSITASYRVLAPFAKGPIF